MMRQMGGGEGHARPDAGHAVGSPGAGPDGARSHPDRRAIGTPGPGVRTCAAMTDMTNAPIAESIFPSDLPTAAEPASGVRCDRLPGERLAAPRRMTGVAVFAQTGSHRWPDLLPATAVAYGELRLDLPGDQHDQLAAFMAHFPGFDDPASFDTKLDAAARTGTQLCHWWCGDLDRQHRDLVQRTGRAGRPGPPRRHGHHAQRYGVQQPCAWIDDVEQHDATYRGRARRQTAPPWRPRSRP